MNKFIKRCTLAVIMCGCSIAGEAQTTQNSGIIFEDNFNNWSRTYNGANAQSYGQWKYFKCSDIYHQGDNKNKAMKIENSDSYAELTLSLSGNAVLSFSYAASAKNTSCNINVSITEGGSFEDGTKTRTTSSLNSQYFSDVNYVIIANASTTKIKFKLASGSSAGGIDDVLVTTAITLDENEDNSTTISNNANKISTVSATRTLKSGIWNTMCLPFNVNNAVMKQATEKDVSLRIFSDYDSNTKVMSFSEVADNDVIAAGTPFLIKISGDKDAVNPTFKAVTVKNTDAQTVTHNGVSFIGTYDKKKLSTSDIFIKADGGLSSADGKSSILGMRAFISGISPKEARLSIDGIADGIDNVLPEAANTDGQWYTLSGTRIAKPTSKGIYVRDGKKIIIKK